VDLMTDGFDCLLSIDLARFAFWAVDAMPAIRLAFGGTADNPRPANEAARREAYLEDVKSRRQAALQQAQVINPPPKFRFRVFGFVFVLFLLANHCVDFFFV
jgi:hypothetical protein